VSIKRTRILANFLAQVSRSWNLEHGHFWDVTWEGDAGGVGSEAGGSTEVISIFLSPHAHSSFTVGRWGRFGSGGIQQKSFPFFPRMPIRILHWDRPMDHTSNHKWMKGKVVREEKRRAMPVG
jgi:hypothetical protein